MVSKEWKGAVAAKPKRHLGIVAPDGTKGRTGSQRRYIVARAYDHRNPDAAREQRWDRRIAILKRTDNLGTAVSERNGRMFSSTPDAAFIWDTVEGAVVA